MTAIAREQQRLIALAKSGLSGLASIGVFETAAQEIVAGLSVAIGAVGSIDSDSVIYQGVALAPHARQSFLATDRLVQRHHLPCDLLLSSNSVLCLPDLAADPRFLDRDAVQTFGIRAYLGVPLRNLAGDCLGVVEAIDLAPRHFSRRDLQFLELIARNLMLELERSPDLEFLAAEQPRPTIALSYLESEAHHSAHSSFDRLRSRLVEGLTQDLRTPLTSVLGMTSVLNQEIYGALRPKQKEYLGIVYDSGQQMLSMVNSLVALHNLNTTLSLAMVGVEPLCQQLSHRLSAYADQRSCRLKLSFDLDTANWPLDQPKIELGLFHLLMRVMSVSDEGCGIRLHVHNLNTTLRFEVWTTHPWLGDSLPLPDLVLLDLDNDDDTVDFNLPEISEISDIPETSEASEIADFPISDRVAASPSPIEFHLRPHLEANANPDYGQLCLLLSCYLFEQHNGHVYVVGSDRSGYRYRLDLPGDPA